MKTMKPQLKNFSDKHKNSINFLLILLIFGMITGVLLSRWISSADVERLSSYLLTTVITSVEPQSFFTSQFVTNILFMLAVFFLGFSLAGIPLIGFVVFTKGVQIGFSCVLYVLTYQLKGVLGILLTLIPQILFDLIALFLVSVISTEISYALIQRCLGYSRSDFSLIHLINSRLNVLIVSLLLIFFSAWIKSTLVIRLMEIFAMME